jgi:hypothetical protein
MKDRRIHSAPLSHPAEIRHTDITKSGTSLSPRVLDLLHDTKLELTRYGNMLAFRFNPKNSKPLLCATGFLTSAAKPTFKGGIEQMISLPKDEPATFYDILGVQTSEQ